MKSVFLYSDDVMHDRGDRGSPSGNSPAPWNINDSGQITGSHQLANLEFRGFIYTDGVLQSIGTLGGDRSFAVAINNAGQVAGGAELADGTSHAYLFDGTVHDLGTLGDGDSRAWDLNNLGHVVGTSIVGGEDRAFLYAGGPMLDLNLLIEPTSGWVLNTARAINDLGQITGTGTFDGAPRAYVLTPVPEPCSLLLAAIGLATLVAWNHISRQQRRCSRF
jgi:probable HAF family extracellular repeat protein